MKESSGIVKIEVLVNDSNHRQMISQLVTFLKQGWHQYAYINIHTGLRGGHQCGLISGVRVMCSSSRCCSSGTRTQYPTSRMILEACIQPFYHQPFSSIACRSSPHWFCQWCRSHLRRHFTISHFHPVHTARRHIGFASGVRVLMQSGFTPPCAVLLHVRRHMVSPVVLGHLGVLQSRR